jgi:hypothetical protein
MCKVSRLVRVPNRSEGIGSQDAIEDETRAIQRTGRNATLPCIDPMDEDKEMLRQRAPLTPFLVNPVNRHGGDRAWDRGSAGVRASNNLPTWHRPAYNSAHKLRCRTPTQDQNDPIKPLNNRNMSQFWNRNQEQKLCAN